eukprot:jgi/Psemu1/32641/gm1.32641_g
MPYHYVATPRLSNPKMIPVCLYLLDHTNSAAPISESIETNKNNPIIEKHSKNYATQHQPYVKSSESLKEEEFPTVVVWLIVSCALLHQEKLGKLIHVFRTYLLAMGGLCTEETGNHGGCKQKHRKDPDYKDNWYIFGANCSRTQIQKYQRLKDCLFVPKSQSQAGRIITYNRINCTIKPRKDGQNLTRITAGGNTILTGYPSETIIDTAGLQTIKMYLDSVLSTPGANPYGFTQYNTSTEILNNGTNLQFEMIINGTKVQFKIESDCHIYIGIRHVMNKHKQSGMLNISYGSVSPVTSNLVPLEPAIEQNLISKHRACLAPRSNSSNSSNSSSSDKHHHLLPRKLKLYPFLHHHI